MALSVPLTRFTSRVGGGSAFYVRPHRTPQMKIILILGCALLLAVTGCKRETHKTQPQVTATATPNGLIEIVTSTPALKMRPPVSEWSKVKIGSSGDIYVNKKQMSLVEFSAECARLKAVGGAIVLFVDTPNHVASPAQAEVMHQIVEAGVAMKAALKESDLE